MKILIVDDSAAMRMMVNRALRQAGFGGHDVREAKDGLDGLERIREDPPDLVLCDWNMPNMTGLELLQKIIEEGYAPGFVFVTTECTAEMRKKADDAGADFFITKPFTADAFHKALGALLES